MYFLGVEEVWGLGSWGELGGLGGCGGRGCCRLKSWGELGGLGFMEGFLADTDAEL